MKKSLSFRLNGEEIRTEERGETIVLDWLRRGRALSGTKEGCREGDCGACLVLLGGPSAQSGEGAASVEWLAVPSCLLALGELDGRQLVTIEGLAAAGPTAVMLALHGEGASQCGFCSPGVVVALTAFLLGPGPYDAASALAAVDGNLCRCTGYGSIRRAAALLAADFTQLSADFPARLASLAARGVIPPALAATMALETASALPAPPADTARLLLGGGTDYFVRNPEGDGPAPEFSDQDPELRRIVLDGAKGGAAELEIGAAVTIREFFASPLVRKAVPGIETYERLFASGPVRARATLAGNIANASPVADMTAVLIALGARLRLRGGAGTRELPLERFFLAYKKIDLGPEESIRAILIPASGEGLFFSFEKASKRARLDIAAVNSAFACRVDPGGSLRGVRLSAGGAGPTPIYLERAAAFLEGKSVSAASARVAADLAVADCSPQSDVRGSASYRSAMLKRFVWAHLIRLSPGSTLAEELFP